ncbi:hypothetical protein BU15DRAFT_61509 [Melanogaster broomeanus]|nr:hypothetical protein BU15DRAFT_61509 [Melanogaster broomeanus]
MNTADPPALFNRLSPFLSTRPAAATVPVPAVRTAHARLPNARLPNASLPNASLPNASAERLRPGVDIETSRIGNAKRWFIVSRCDVMALRKPSDRPDYGASTVRPLSYLCIIETALELDRPLRPGLKQAHQSGWKHKEPRLLLFFDLGLLQVAAHHPLSPLQHAALSTHNSDGNARKAHTARHILARCLLNTGGVEAGSAREYATGIPCARPSTAFVHFDARILMLERPVDPSLELSERDFRSSYYDPWSAQGHQLTPRHTMYSHDL